MTRHDLLAVAAVIVASLAMLALLGLCRRFSINPEVLRKLAHLGTGALALPFPWIFSSPRPVLLVCGLALLLLAGVSRLPFARVWLGASLYSIGRESRGNSISPSPLRFCSCWPAETRCSTQSPSWC